MFQALRKHLTPSTLIAFVALVFAITGGAFAATGGGNGGKGAAAAASAAPLATVAKAKPKTKAGARGPAGPAGKTGAAGPAGPAGSAGAAGAKGENGAAGGQGPQGEKGLQGEKGETGKEGTPGKPGKNGTFGDESLPAGKTLKGVYFATAAAEAKFSDPGFGDARTAVSFALPVAAGVLTLHYIAKGGALPEGCTGDAEEPGAAEGNLCIFSESENDVLGAAIFSKGTPEATIGFLLEFYSAEKGVISAIGTWAVTG